MEKVTKVMFVLGIIALAVSLIVGYEGPCFKLVSSESESAPLNAAPVLAEKEKVSGLQLIDFGAKVNVTTEEILAEMEHRGLRPAADSEVREWLNAGHEIASGLIVIAELDRPEILEQSKRKLVPAFMKDKETGRLIEMSIVLPETSAFSSSGWFTVNYRFAAVKK